SAAIQSAITNAVGILQSLFTDPITVSIDFRYATTDPDGVTPLAAGTLAQSNFPVYAVPYATYLGALTADAGTAIDATALAHLPAPLAMDMVVSSAGGRAVALNTPGAMDAQGNVGGAGTFDGIVTLNSSEPFSFDRGSLA